MVRVGLGGHPRILDVFHCENDERPLDLDRFVQAQAPVMHRCARNGRCTNEAWMWSFSAGIAGDRSPWPHTGSRRWPSPCLLAHPVLVPRLPNARADAAGPAGPRTPSAARRRFESGSCVTSSVAAQSDERPHAWPGSRRPRTPARRLWATWPMKARQSLAPALARHNTGARSTKRIAVQGALRSTASKARRALHAHELMPDTKARARLAHCRLALDDFSVAA